jgi:sterol 14-demethylase
MDARLTFSTVVPPLALGLGAYLFHRLTTRVAPGIPYAGEGSWSERLQIPVEYGKDPVGTLAKMRKKLGNVFCVDLFIMRIVFILGAEGNREVLRSAEEDLSFWEQIRWAMGPKLGFSGF